ncbi:MAG: hypothetical protein JWM54_2107 [Acidobacteriaceae bacterium]|nr:hypothetical protein [Acidobacteriaceae bacterium]
MLHRRTIVVRFITLWWRTVIVLAGGRGYRALDDHVALQFPWHLRSGAEATEKGAALRTRAAHRDLPLLRFVGTELGRTDNRPYR